jgi:hypothetical protein
MAVASPSWAVDVSLETQPTFRDPSDGSFYYHDDVSGREFDPDNGWFFDVSSGLFYPSDQASSATPPQLPVDIGQLPSVPTYVQPYVQSYPYPGSAGYGYPVVVVPPVAPPVVARKKFPDRDEGTTRREPWHHEQPTRPAVVSQGSRGAMRAAAPISPQAAHGSTPHDTSSRGLSGC